ATLVIDVFDDGTPSTLINDGTIINTGIYTNSGALVNNGTFTNNSIFDNSGTFSNPGTLSGINTSHTQDFTNAGTLSPGNSPGTYTFNNNYSAQTTANLQIELENATTFDIVTVTGTAAINGTLEVTLLDNYSPIVGDTFTILTAGNISGTFDTINLPAGYNWDVRYTATEVILEIIPITLSPVVFLQGALLSNGNSSVMRDDLRSLGYLPTTSPYTDGLTCDASVFNTGGTNGTGNTNNDIVDWVWIELRDATDNTLVIDGQSALLQRDGDVVSIDGISVVSFNQASGNYYLAIKHRNHLAVMTTNTITLNRTATTINFTESTTPITFGTNAQATIADTPNVLALWAGNANGDTIVQYSGTSPDTPSILSNVLNDAGNFLNFPTYSVSGYNTNDIDMNGSTQYSGTTPDTPFILQNVLAHPGNFLNFSTYPIEEQLPEN
uniref:hypothetical protein n=1 Tax=uncultured Kordia sp. TaxID=507699 RepID=UPI0026146BB9